LLGAVREIETVIKCICPTSTPGCFDSLFFSEWTCVLWWEYVAVSCGFTWEVEAVESSSCNISADASRTRMGTVLQFLCNTPGRKAGFPPVSSSAQLALLLLQCHSILDIKLDTAAVLNNSRFLLRNLQPT